jgi:hypothetical protein
MNRRQFLRLGALAAAAPKALAAIPAPSYVMGIDWGFQPSRAVLMILTPRMTATGTMAWQTVGDDGFWRDVDPPSFDPEYAGCWLVRTPA